MKTVYLKIILMWWYWKDLPARGGTEGKTHGTLAARIENEFLDIFCVGFLCRIAAENHHSKVCVHSTSCPETAHSYTLNDFNTITLIWFSNNGLQISMPNWNTASQSTPCLKTAPCFANSSHTRSWHCSKDGWGRLGIMNKGPFAGDSPHKRVWYDIRMLHAFLR